MATTDEVKTHVVFVRGVPEALHKKIRVRAAREHKTIEAVAKEALAAWVKDDGR